MSAPRDLSPVIESGMCIGCGACVAVDEDLTLELDDRTQSWRPSGPSGADAASVCPAVKVDFAGLHDWLFKGSEVGPHGVVEAVFLAQSMDHERNRRASSGGLIKEIMLALLAREDVDGIITLDRRDGLDYRARIVTDPAEVDRLPGSIYHDVRFDDALTLLRENSGRFVLVAIPCNLEGIWSYIRRFEPALADRIHTTIGLLCGWTYTHHSLRAIADFKGIDYDDIEEVSYRGGGPVGKLELQTKAETVEVSRRIDFDYQVAFDRSFNIPRCHLCVNHSNFLADVVVGDAWLPSTVMTRTGISLVVCRRQSLVGLVRALEADGRITLSEVSVDEITESQTRRVVFGDFAYAYADYLAEIGEHRPEMTGPNRPAAKLTDREAVARFHRSLSRKLELQRSRRYRWLWWRKATVEFGSLVRRYVAWFLVRILRIKSLLGKRQEVSREKIRKFR